MVCNGEIQYTNGGKAKKMLGNDTATKKLKDVDAYVMGNLVNGC